MVSPVRSQLAPVAAGELVPVLITRAKERAAWRFDEEVAQWCWVEYTGVVDGCERGVSH